VTLRDELNLLRAQMAEEFATRDKHPAASAHQSATRTSDQRKPVKDPKPKPLAE
jgi:hypothetical protein